MPFSRASTFSSASSALGTPPWYLRGTDSCNDNSAVGEMPPKRHLMSQNFFSAEVSAEACFGYAVIGKLRASFVALTGCSRVQYLRKDRRA